MAKYVFTYQTTVEVEAVDEDTAIEEAEEHLWDSGLHPHELDRVSITKVEESADDAA